MLRSLSHAINPNLSLAYFIANWNQVSLELREPTRKRKPQLQHLADELAIY